MNANDFVSVNHIIAEVTKTVGDEDFKKGFSKGWYISRIQDALQELAFDTFYQKITVDYDFPKETLQIDLPKNAFNVREIYLFNKSCCSPNTSVRVYWKRLYNNGNGGDGYTSSVRESNNNSSDPYLPNQYDNYRNDYTGRTLYYANMQNGKIMFSSSCRSYNKVRIVYNGMGGEIGDIPIIPRFFERAIVDYVEERFLNAMKNRNPRLYRSLWSDAYARLNDLRNGSWEKARMRVSSLNTWEKESLEEYLSGILHK